MEKAICVLGMHRSGTSMLMNILNNLGLYLGKEEDVLAYGEDNPEGFWEHRLIVQLHEKILSELDSSWDSLAPFQDNWLSNSNVIEYKKEIIKVIKKEFINAPVWGWKDPRTCLLLPMWNDIYNVLDMDVKYIILIRNPLDIANSLHKRNGIAIQKGIALWYYYMINVIEHTKGYNKLIVEYDSVFDNPLENINRIADFTGLKLNEEKEAKMLNSIKPNLRHSQSTYKELCLYTEERAALLYKEIKEKLLSDHNEEYSVNDYKFYTRLVQLQKLEKQSIELEQKKIELIAVKQELEDKNSELHQAIQTKSQKQAELQQVKEVIEQTTAELNEVKEEVEQTTAELNEVKEEVEQKTAALDEVKEVIEQKTVALDEVKEEINAELDEYKLEIEHSNAQLELAKLENDKLNNRLNHLESTVMQAINQSILLSDTKLFKFVHLMYRIKHQLIKGNMKMKRSFISWFFKRWNKRVYINEHEYNPLYQVINILEQPEVNDEPLESLSLSESHDLTSQSVDPPILKVDLKDKYDKFDVILLSIIDYDFRHQRPQHLANAFANNGHRVFFINSNLSKANNVYNEQSSNDNLTICSLASSRFNNIYELNYSDDLSEISLGVERIVNEYAIRDCLIIVEYPTWVSAAGFLKEKYGFRIVTDYLDDYTGFKDTMNNSLINATSRLLEISDKVIASSNFLADKARQYNSQVDIVRNGTEFAHFNKEIDWNPSDKKKKIVGYYGAVAHWFDFEKVTFLAENLKHVEIVVIGQVTDGYEILSKYSNIKLLGEIPYVELPQYLRQFDVCLIPFNTKTDLIKATNPVKFYEYLSMGKKVVATEIPELLPYKDKYVYLSDDSEQFLDYVKLCLDGLDSLASVEESIEFARMNDWDKRAEVFLEYSKPSFPKVSIIVLTYNQLDYTKQCISSILDKTAYPNYELIIVDNNSDDGTKEFLTQIQDENGHVKVVLNQTNYGFAGGNNIGLKEATGDYYILLNNDTVVTRGWITGLLKHFDNNNKLGLLGPVTNSIGNEAMIKTDYDHLDEMDDFAYSYTTTNMGELYGDINALAMFCVVISSEAFEKIGYLDENYKVGMFEDDDYSIAARRSGFELSCAEDVFIHHFGSVSFKKLENKEYREIFENNKAYFEQKWNTTWIPHKYRSDI